VSAPTASPPFGPTDASSLPGDYRHIGAFFQNAEERDRTLLPFIREGFERREKAFHILNPRERDGHTRRLADAGIDIERSAREGRLELRAWDETYLRGSQFAPEAMYRFFGNELDTARQQGFPRSRVIAHMEWACEREPGHRVLVDYETRFNLVFPQCSDWIVCCYDLSRFDGAIALDLVRAHPMLIVGGVLQENPLFVPPDDLLRELNAR
jgi:hypothetical protein